jgi:hypothetical protein
MNRLTLGVLALGAALVTAPHAAKANFLLNGNFETTITTVLTFGYPTPAPPGAPSFDLRTAFPNWAASAWNGLGGASGGSCPTSIFGLPGCVLRGNVANVQDDVTFSALPRPAALYQTVELQPGAYRFGGDFALAMRDIAVGDNQSQAFLRIYQGSIVFDGTDPRNPPIGATGALLASIDLSPAQFANSEFTLVHGILDNLLARPFETFEGLFEVTGTDPADVTMQLVVLPRRTTAAGPPRYSSDPESALIQATSLRVYADNLFIEATRIQPVPGPGALGVFAVALAGLVAARRRKAA